MADGRSLPLTETTLGQRLKALGYATAIAGKWHLGNFAETCPPSVASTITSA
jgi:arylsulfatase A-like enzyme